MRLIKCVLLCAVLAISTLEPIYAKRSFGFGSSKHGYPQSGRGGLSGSGSHRYPSSGGLSGTGSHGYPSSGGMSGNSHGYPSSGGLSGSGGSHGYPSSGGLSGTGGRQPSHQGYPSGQSHGYPSNGHSGGSSYPSYPARAPPVHYNYNPPKQISYTPVHGGQPISYPVYHGTPPNYVYKYKDSGSKYGTLLAGLALMNLGTLAGTAYAIHKVNNNNNGNGNSGPEYKGHPGETCKFGMKKRNGDYEETRIDCSLISSFIYQEEAKQSGHNASVVNNNATNNTTPASTANVVNGTGEVSTEQPAAKNPLYEMLPNGTLVPVNANSTEIPPNTNTTASNMANSTAPANETLTNALDVKGPPVAVTPDMECYVSRVTPNSRMKRTIPCGLLQTYAEKSIQKSAAARLAPAFTILTAIAAVLLVY